MVIDQNQIAFFKIKVHPSGCIAKEQISDAQIFHHSYRERDLLHAIAFIIMKAALHGDHFCAANFACDELAFMELNGGDGEMRYLMVWYGLIYFYFIDERSEAGAQYDSGFCSVKSSAF